MSTEDIARGFALAAHGSQKYGNAPYIVHPAAVCQVLTDFGITNPYIRQAAWLHDTLEDTPKTREEITAIFGEVVASLVWAVSGFGPTRTIRNICAYEKIVAFRNPWPAALKFADRITNSEKSRENRPDLWKLYRKEYLDFHAMMSNTGIYRTKVGLAMLSRLEAALDVTP